MGFVKNRTQLLSHGNTRLRDLALEVIEHALTAANPYEATRKLVRLDTETLTVGHLSFDLRQHKRIFLVGAGKATYGIAKALEDLLGERITDGVVVCKYGQEGDLAYSRKYLAAHPIPDESGFAAAKEAMVLAEQTQPGDIVFACVTGGSSALLPYPIPEITLEEKKQVNRILLTCGANIVEINAVRKHLSQIKGGRLAKMIDPRAHLINLTVSDVIGDPLDYITDPTVPDTSTFDDARRTLTKYNLWARIPPAVAGFLNSCGPERETPKQEDLSGRLRHDFILVAGDAACVAAEQVAKSLGFNTMILSTMLEGDSKELGKTFAAIAKEIVLNQRPLQTPAAVIGGGETTVRLLEGGSGLGGPNQEFALSLSAEVDSIEGIVAVGLDSDGTDGPTDLAGAILDDRTVIRAKALGIDIYDCLEAHDVTPALIRLGDAVDTGATGTNVNDLKFILVGYP